MLYMPSSSLLPRFGITVSRRVGNAVVRNRVKRWIREVLRQRGSAIAGAWDIVIIARPSARGAGLHRIERDFQGFSSWISKKSR
jgi:ribonuclease P protein component